MDMKNIIENRKRTLECLIEKKKKALENVPTGILRISPNKTNWQYYKRENHHDKNGKYIKKKDINLARALGQKEYDQKVLIVAEKELKILCKLSEIYQNEMVEDIYKNYSIPMQKMVTPIQKTDEAYIKEWLALAYKEKSFYEESPEFYSDNNERMRSKSEVLIANMLKKLKIPYKYEKPLELYGIGIVYPDFTILDVKNRKEIYWEHLGLMDDRDYREKALSKITYYEKNGYFPGESLIITYETSKQPINMKVAEQLIKRILV